MESLHKHSRCFAGAVDRSLPYAKRNLIWFFHPRLSKRPTPQLAPPPAALSARGKESTTHNPFPPDGRTPLRTGRRRARRRFPPSAWGSFSVRAQSRCAPVRRPHRGRLRQKDLVLESLQPGTSAESYLRRRARNRMWSALGRSCRTRKTPLPSQSFRLPGRRVATQYSWPPVDERDFPSL